MHITRRQFLKYCSIAAGALGLTTTDLLKLKEATAKLGGPQVIWLQGASCTGDSTSLLNTIFYTDGVGLLITNDNALNLVFHQTVMNAAGTDINTNLGYTGPVATDSMAVVQALLPGGGGSSTYAEWSSDTHSLGSESIKLHIADRTQVLPLLEAGAAITPKGYVLINEFDMSFRFKTSETQAPIVQIDVYSQDDPNPTAPAITTITSHFPGVNYVAGGDLTPLAPGNGTFGPTDWRTLRLSDFILWSDTNATPTDIADDGTDPGPDLAAAGWTTWNGYAGTDVSGNGIVIDGIKDFYGTYVVSEVRIIDQANATFYSGTNSCTMYIDDIVIAGALYDDEDTLITLYPTAIAGTGGGYVLAIEGSVVTGTPPGVGTSAGEFCEVGPMTGTANETMLNAFLTYARSAAAVVAVGTCASYGGIPALGATGAKGCAQVLKENGITTPVVNVPGCPAHPDWIVGTLAKFIAGGVSALGLDSKGRPSAFYGMYACNGNQGNLDVDIACPWRYNNDRWNADANNDGIQESGFGKDYIADDPAHPIGESRALAKYKWGSIATGGDSWQDYDGLPNQTTNMTTVGLLGGCLAEGCLGVLGCRGRKTHADCAYRKWNANTTLTPGTLGVNWCVGSRGGCQGCTEPDFPMKKRFYTFV